MNKIFLISTRIFFIILIFSIPAFAQTPQPTATPPADEEVLKISTTLIQLDVIVTDKKGNQVTDLKPEDFEVYEDGKRQEITNFSYISINKPDQPDDSTADKNSNQKDKNFIAPPPAKLKLEQVRRTYAIVVDDLGLSFDNVRSVQQSLRKFINTQMADGDLVAIIRTGSGIGALQSFTSDKSQLLAAIDKIKWNPQGRGGISTFAAVGTELKDDLNGKTDSQGNVKSVEGTAEDKEFQDQFDEFRNENFSVGTLGALNYIIRGMNNLPGRKSLMLISEGFPLVSKTGGTTTQSRVFDTMRVLADLANRSSVVIYTLDPRGLQIPGMATAEDNIAIVPPDAAAGETLQDRDSDFRDSQQSLRYLAYQTGGIPYVNQNNIRYGMEKVLEDQKGYYLIGYQPDADTFDPKKGKYNKLTVKLKRDDLKVRYRDGFYGVTDKKLEAVKQTPQQQIYTALTSPFGSNDISLSLNTFFAEDEKSVIFLRSLVGIDIRDLKFAAQTDGTRQANFDLIAMTFGDNGTPVDETAKNYTIKIGENVYQNLLEKGFIYNLIVPLKKSGAYQFRIALRDSATEKIGSASQFIEIPNLKKNRLTLSGIFLNNYTISEWQNALHGGTSPLNGEEKNLAVDTVSRRFKNGTVLRYDYIIYNAKPNPTQIQVQTRLFLDGKLVTEGKPTALDTSGQTDPKRLEAAGAITLGKNLAPGNYVLQIAATDDSIKGKYRIATRWIDFEIIE